MMKRFRYGSSHRGIQFDIVLVCESRKKACELLGISMYMLRTWVSVTSPLDDSASRNPGELFVEFFRSGEIPYFIRNELIGTLIKKEIALRSIDMHRQRFKTHREVMEFYEKNKS